MLRLGIFLLAIPILYFILNTNILVFAVFFISLISLFIWAVIKQQNAELLLQNAEALKAINENELESIKSHNNLYYNGEGYQIQGHAFAEDLDVFGQHSIFKLLNRSKTFFGNHFLKDAFLKPKTKLEIEARQEAIQELEPEIDWRQNLMVQLFALENQHDNNLSDTIDHHLDMDFGFLKNNVLSIYRKSLLFIWAAIIVLYFFNVGLANTLASFIFIGNLLVSGKYASQISEVQSRLSQASSGLKKYIEALKVIFDKKWHSSLLSDRAKAFEKTNNKMPIKSLATLSSLIDQLDYRLNLLIAIFGNGIFLWDINVVSRIASWKKKNRGKVKEIFEYIGFLEEMTSLATWAYNHPNYAYASIHTEYLILKGSHIEHPLIPSNQNVPNDFEMSSSNKVTIITGSNMSGKSTFLRTLALNMILGYTGTKVAASSFICPVVKVVTYMRIKDALEENVSTFKAELNRIKLILDILETDERPMFFIDEMLRGTNSKDKLNGSIGITKKLLQSDTFAMIATHDIKLAEMGKTNNQIANYYFDIDYEDGNLVFDYKIKEGICENFNASFLLGQLGIQTDL